MSCEYQPSNLCCDVKHFAKQETLVLMMSQFVYNFADEWETIVSLHNSRKYGTKFNSMQCVKQTDINRA